MPLAGAALLLLAACASAAGTGPGLLGAAGPDPPLPVSAPPPTPLRHGRSRTRAPRRSEHPRPPWDSAPPLPAGPATFAPALPHEPSATPAAANDTPPPLPAVEDDTVTEYLRILEAHHRLGANCTERTSLRMLEGSVERFATDRFRVGAEVAVNRANLLTRLWRYAPPKALHSEYFLRALIVSAVEFDKDVYAASDCYERFQFEGRRAFCPRARRLPEGSILVEDLAAGERERGGAGAYEEEEWFAAARASAERVVREQKHFSRGFHTYTVNESTHSARESDEILSVSYADGRWSAPHFDCGGANAWLLTFAVPFFGFRNGSYFFKGCSGVDMDLRRVDVDQCPPPTAAAASAAAAAPRPALFAASDKCHKRTTQCVAVPGRGFRRGSYECACRRGYYFPDTDAPPERRSFAGDVVEEAFDNASWARGSVRGPVGDGHTDTWPLAFACLPCAEGCASCVDGRPCVAPLNWPLRTTLLALTAVTLCCLPAAALFTWKFANVKAVRAASPALLRFIALGAGFMYCTVIVAYPRPTMMTCTARIWLREVGFALTYGALMLKTWRVSVIFRVRSAAAVRISDGALLRRLGAMVAAAVALLAARTLLTPPRVEARAVRTPGLSTTVCTTDWWDHAFSAIEALFLVWGIRLCIRVRKAPSEFNESKFISIAIYNEFLLSILLNISMFFLQSPANPDLLYAIFFVHTQLTVTMLLGLIFGSKVWLVARSRGKQEESSSSSKVFTGKFGSSSVAAPSSLSTAVAGLGYSSALAVLGETEAQCVQSELRILQGRLEHLRARCLRAGDRHLAARVAMVQEAARSPTPPSRRVPAAKDAASPKKAGREAASRGGDGGGAGGGTDGAGAEADDAEVASSSREHSRDASAQSHPLSSPGETVVEATVEASVEAAPGAKPGSPDAAAGTAAGAKASRRRLHSGHRRTRSIVIDLDARSRFTEEVTV